ncbi:solute carrier family 23 member 1-like [Crassostrea virginica]
MTLGGTMSLPFILASLFCPENESQVRAQLLSITMFMCGLATILQCPLGVRLPIIQGGSHTFVAPIVAMLTLEQFRCPTEVDGFHGNASVHIPWERRMREVWIFSSFITLKLISPLIFPFLATGVPAR